MTLSPNPNPDVAGVLAGLTEAQRLGVRVYCSATRSFVPDNGMRRFLLMAGLIETVENFTTVGTPLGLAVRDADRLAAKQAGENGNV